MKPFKKRARGRGSLEIIEEAVHLLRMSPGSTLAIYYIGALPFVLGLLYFWADMSRSPFASHHTVEAALGVTALFLWMKFWQTLFLHALRAQISSQPQPPWTFRRIVRILLVQTIIQPSGLLLLPLALIPIGIPFIWCYAFYQNAAVLGDGESDEIKTVLKRSWRQSTLWPSENIVLLIILFAFGFFLFLNLMTVTLMLPSLVKMLLGIESIYTQSTMSMLNTTFFAAVFGFTYLCLDPLIKACYLLRCFYGESLQSGLDLKAELKQFSPTASTVVAIMLLVASLLSATTLRAQQEPAIPKDVSKPAITTPGIPAPKLDQAIQEVIKQTKYTWRMPRKKVVEDDTESKGPIGRFLDKVIHSIKGWAVSIRNWARDLWDRWFNNRKVDVQHKSGSSDWSAPLKVFLTVLLIVVAVALVILLVRVFQKRQFTPVTVNSEAIPSTPDLADENVGAEQLPEDGWIKLGRELLARGELRLAMRAFYFASLAHLAARNLITIAKFKSNRDYERELRRRGHSLPDLLLIFGETVLVFDRSWYGMHEVNPELVNQFASYVERIKGV
ncbi:DUF4129 domain-containing protein [Pedosphaera parvula]|uniref:DUF4129 domain-containing protein n=1 Tax=Pedosphaera parvula (strain Ellin514) TaxID=320771 RepID=B9XGE2_PEDPL|nr:DUF4129 domain-containing protein [Pedosphaera parvula]EEF60993.1 conserved hypothetical protein [Pedosphaera parvula Ellin514]